MELKWLEDYITLASTQSFSRAAEARHVTQSAFSRRIKQLEQWLDVVLVNRATFPAELTKEGRAFLPVAQDAVRNFYATRLALQPNHAKAGRAVTFAALHTLTVTFFPHWLRGISVAMGGLTSRLSPDRGGFEDNIAPLMDGDVDFFLTYTHPSVPMLIDPNRFPSVKLGEERLMPVSLADGRGPLIDFSVQSGAAVDYLSYGDFSFFGAALADKFASGPAFSRNIRHENTMSIGLKAMALAGWGIAWLPESLIASELRTGELVLASHDPYWNLTADIRIYRHDAKLHDKAEQFWQYVVNKS